MKITANLFIAGLILFGPVALATSVDAGNIERACRDSGRSAASSARCNCIQGIADQLLTNKDQRLAASFFTDPQKAQSVRMSGRRSDETFWTRYRQFGSAATNYCR